MALYHFTHDSHSLSPLLLSLSRTHTLTHTPSHARTRAPNGLVPARPLGKRLTLGTLNTCECFKHYFFSIFTLFHLLISLFIYFFYFICTSKPLSEKLLYS